MQCYHTEALQPFRSCLVPDNIYVDLEWKSLNGNRTLGAHIRLQEKYSRKQSDSQFFRMRLLLSMHNGSMMHVVMIARQRMQSISSRFQALTPRQLNPQAKAPVEPWM